MKRGNRSLGPPQNAENIENRKFGLIKEVNRELNTSGNLCVFAVDWK